MSTSPVYASIRAALQQHLPSVIDSQIASLGLAIVGAVESMSSQMAKIARAMPLDTTELAKEQRLRRLLDNARLTQADHYQPIVQQALHGLKGQRVQLLIDRVLLRDQHNILVVSVGFRRRSIPLVWRALEHRGSSSLTDQQELIQTAVKRLPRGVRISVHGDSEFRSRELFDWLRRQGYDAMLGIRGELWVYATADPRAEGQPLAARCKRCHRRRRVGANASIELRPSPIWHRSTSDRSSAPGRSTCLPGGSATTMGRWCCTR